MRFTCGRLAERSSTDFESLRSLYLVKDYDITVCEKCEKTVTVVRRGSDIVKVGEESPDKGDTVRERT
jgi:hypothetical protein